MKSKLALSAILAGLSIGAQANNCGTASMFERGTNNGWVNNQTPMVCNFWGQWQITANFSAPGSLKFELTGTSPWGENYGDNNAADDSVNANGANIAVPQAGNTGIVFDYVKKTYKISHCNGNAPSLDAGGPTPAPRSMACGSDGRWSQDLLFGPSRILNTDTSSPWPRALTSINLINDLFQPVRTITPPVSGRYRVAVTSGTFASELIAQDCGGNGLNLSYVNFTGHEQNLNMTCNAQTLTYSLDYDPAISGNPYFRFIDGADVAYGDNLADGTLDVSGNGLTVAVPSRITVDLHAKTYQIQPLNQPCGTASLALLAPNATGNEQSNPMTCGTDNKWHYSINPQSTVPFRLKDAQNVFWGDNQPDGTLDSSGNLILASSIAEVVVDYPAKTYELRNSNWKRTVVFIYAPTAAGQTIFVRGGIDHSYAQVNLGLTCTTANKLCAIPTRHRNLKNANTNVWKINDKYLDWYGAETGQNASAQGSPLDWTTNLWPAAMGTPRTLAVDGYGVTPLNTWGSDYWILDVDMDCSKTVNGWFEVKSFISNGPGWEGNIAQAGTPYVTTNHFAQCGKLNKFARNSNAALIQNL